MSERVTVLEDGRQLRWRVGHDDPLISDPATADIMECIGLVAGELGDEPRAASGYVALRTLRRESADLLAACEAALPWAATVMAYREDAHPDAVKNHADDIALIQAAIAKAKGPTHAPDCGHPDLRGECAPDCPTHRTPTDTPDGAA